jgi:hypothetical protein
MHAGLSPRGGELPVENLHHREMLLEYRDVRAAARPAPLGGGRASFDSVERIAS